MRPHRRTNTVITDEDLSAFADGRLRPRQASRVATHLRDNPADVDRLCAYWRQENELRQAFDPVLDEPTPQTWTRENDSGFGWWRAGLAAAVVAACALVWQWSALPGPEQPRFTTAVLQAYGQPDIAAAAGPAPGFAHLGLEPVGRRRFSSGGNALTEYRYRTAEGRRLALYIADEGGDQGGSLRILEKNGSRLVEWGSDGKRYALVGQGNVSELTHLAVQVRHALAGPVPTLAETAESQASHAAADNPTIGVQEKGLPGSTPAPPGSPANAVITNAAEM